MRSCAYSLKYDGYVEVTYTHATLKWDVMGPILTPWTLLSGTLCTWCKLKQWFYRSFVLSFQHKPDRSLFRISFEAQFKCANEVTLDDKGKLDHHQNTTNTTKRQRVDIFQMYLSIFVKNKRKLPC